MNPGYTVEAASADIYIFRPATFVAKIFNEEQAKEFTDKLNKLWEEI